MSLQTRQADARPPFPTRLAEVLRHYLDLGLTAFGGPAVHIIILRKRFVDKYKWIDERTFIDLFALSNALPGPASTKIAFSIAVVKHGVSAGILAFLCWSLPGALGMAGLAAGITNIPEVLPPIVLALFSGLNAAAVGLIALAAYQLGTAASTDRVTLTLVWLSASFGICYHAPWMYPCLIVAGGLVTLLWDLRREVIIKPARRAWGLVRGQAQRQDERGSSNIELSPVPAGDTAAQRGLSDVRASPVSSVPHSAAFPTPPASPTSRPTAPHSEDLPDPPKLDLAASHGSASSRMIQSRHSTASAAAPSSAAAVDVEAPATPAARENTHLQVVSPRSAYALIAGFVLLLVIPLATRGGLANAGKPVPRELDFFSNMILAGTIIFGGGPVVIPLLRDYVVVPGWVSSRDFLLIFAILQAFPGPNFNFAVALGYLTLPYSTASRIGGALLGWFGIFSPGLILKLGLLPLYSHWRDKVIVRSALRGLNAAASGLVFTAVWQLFLVGYIYTSADGSAGGGGQTFSGPLTADPFWAVVASGSFLASRNFASPPWASIIGGGLAGLAWYGVRSR